MAQNGFRASPPQTSMEVDRSREPRSSSDQSGFSSAPVLASVTLPKGGGAIRGLDEKLSVDAASGSANLGIPLPFNAGRSGFTPSLQLSYLSGAGNGPFGFGWALDLPTITRKTDKGLPRYIDAEESDVFILGGVEDLVPLLNETGARRQIPATAYGVDYTIFFYRPRIDAGFSRIERWVESGTGISHWRTLSRDNVTTLFGEDPLSRVADPASVTRIFSWSISRSWDDQGNLAVYQYVPEDSSGVSVSQAHETNRTTASRSAQTYLKSVRYGNVQPFYPNWDAATPPALPTDFLFEMVVDYGDHANIPPTPSIDPPWPVRPDPFSTYRAGFEIRTYRRAERLLFFNNFPGEPTAGAYLLVRALDLTYSDQQAPSDPRNPNYTFMTSLTQTGYALDGTARSLPPLEFDYSQPQIQSAIRALDPGSAANLPVGISNTQYRWVDLDGEGLSGILSETDGAWYYKRNLSANNANADVSPTARFGPLETVASLPSRQDLASGEMLLDLSGAGQLDIVALDDREPGFFKRTTEAGFEPFQRFLSLPELKLDWRDPNVKFIDLTGDGLADILITEDGLFTFHASLGEAGFDVAQLVRTPWDEEKGPKVVLSDGSDTIFVADMSGDGLNDIVRIRNGEICYWPNIGYGKFGVKVTMDLAPRFVSEDQFDPHRIRLADVDGSGTADLLYLGADGIRLWFNQAGNAWSTPTLIAVFPSADAASRAEVIDLLGTGTGCLVWSSPLPSESRTPLLYVDLMGGQKPHLLTTMRNNLGGESRVTYAPSTRFYRADADRDQPWITRLPFPVQVVERVETFDWVGRNRFVSRYAYHHGYYDGYEREFRGFGRVEQWDTEEFRNDTDFQDQGSINWDQVSWSPPMRTVSWFHTGAFLNAAGVSQQYAQEYWKGDAVQAPLPDSLLPADLDGFSVQEAYRALKGRLLHVETYAEDGTGGAAVPYSVAEHNYIVSLLQPRGLNLHAVFKVAPRETVTSQYERDATDPRVMHEVVLETDLYGNSLRQMSVGYPRRVTDPPEPQLPPDIQARLKWDQQRLHIRAREDTYTNPLDDLALSDEEFAVAHAYRVPVTAAVDQAEITGVISPDAGGRFGFDDLDTLWKSLWAANADPASSAPYEAIPGSDVDGTAPQAGTAQRRWVSQERTLYRADDLSALLGPTEIQSRALPGCRYQAALTPGLLSTIFGDLATPMILQEAGYIQLPDETGWWTPTGRVFYSAGDDDTAALELDAALAHFFLPRRAIDPFNNTARITYDAVDLLPIKTTDPVGNVTSAANDYRVLMPMQVTDPNGNRSKAAFDAHGFLVGTAVMGKTTEKLGDCLVGFVADLDDATIASQLAAPLADPGSVLGQATTRLIYDVGAYMRSAGAASPLPVAVYTIARETHASDLGTGAVCRYQYHFAYSDGFGRTVQQKALTASGPIEAGGAVVAPRWLGSGWTVFNNKGKAVRQFEPFFSATQGFEFDAQSGVATRLFYDPPGRLIATLKPDNSWQKTVFDPWHQEVWDGNDTTIDPVTKQGFDPRDDKDVGGYFRQCLGITTPFETWYGARIAGTYGATAEAQAANQDAAEKAAVHAGTPAVTYFDSLGRSCLAIADNGGAARYASRTALDTEGKPLAVFDPLGRRAEEYCLAGAGASPYCAGTDMIGNTLYRINSDSGVRRFLPDIAGKPVRSWDARGHAFRFTYDAARRPIQRWISSDGAAEQLIDLSCYGEAMADTNLCGRLFRHYDMAGYVESSAFDYSGNLLATARELALVYRAAVDWTALAGLSTGAALDAAAVGAGLVASDHADRFSSSSAFDALNRPIQVVTPHSATMSPNVLRPNYDESAQLLGVDIWLQQAVAPTALLDPTTADRHAVANVTYNARGQRIAASLGNGTFSSYAYDPETFRLTNLQTIRPASYPAAQQSVQDLGYFYDPVGNITTIRDDADIQNVVFFNNQRVEPSAGYTYDPIYRLIAATGREHLGQTNGVLNAPPQVAENDGFRMFAFQPGDGSAMGTYQEAYSYDVIGNLLTMAHVVASGNWTRRYSYAEASQILPGEMANRLTATSLPGDAAAGPYSARYSYDAHGNMTSMPHLQAMSWDEDDRLRSTTPQAMATGTPLTTYYCYDAVGSRVRKVTDNQAAAGEVAARRSERIYLGPVDIYREYGSDGSTITLARETFHIQAARVVMAQVETRVIGTDPAPAEQVRYQHSNHLSSAVLELDDQAAVLSYEEYFPFGSTSYQSVAAASDVAKRYRFTGKERDSENAFYYHGARYYASWLGRWTACDPTGLKDGLGTYVFVSNNPIRLQDPTGTEGIPQPAPAAGVTPPSPPPPPASPSIGSQFGQQLKLTGGATLSGGKVVPNPKTSLATDPLLKDYALAAQAATKPGNYAAFSKEFYTLLKSDLNTAAADSPIAKAFQVKNGEVYFRSGQYAGQRLNLAHTVGRQLGENVGADPALRTDLYNLDPIGQQAHLSPENGGIGHPENVATKQGRLLGDEAVAGIKRVASESAEAQAASHGPGIAPAPEIGPPAPPVAAASPVPVEPGPASGAISEALGSLGQIVSKAGPALNVLGAVGGALFVKQVADEWDVISSDGPPNLAKHPVGSKYQSMFGGEYTMTPRGWEETPWL